MIKGILRTIPTVKPFGFIRSSTGLDNIFLHRDDYHGDWSQLVKAYATNKGPIYVQFELGNGDKGPRASKCERITEDEYNQI